VTDATSNNVDDVSLTAIVSVKHTNSDKWRDYESDRQRDADVEKHTGRHNDKQSIWRVGGSIRLIEAIIGGE